MTIYVYYVYTNNLVIPWEFVVTTGTSVSCSPMFTGNVCIAMHYTYACI